MIVDAHVHFPMGKVETLDDIAKVVERGVALGVEKFWNLGDVLKYGSYPTRKQIVEINDSTINVLREFPERMLGFCFLNPALEPAFLRDEMERCLAIDGFIGVKLENAVNCRDERLDPIMELVVEKNAILLHHAWYLAEKTQPDASEPADVADLATRHPDATIIMAHLAGCGVRGVLDIKNHPNVLIDTSGGQPVSGLVEYAVSELGAERVIYGSDIPGRDFPSQIGRVLGADIPQREKELILSGNAIRLADAAS